MSKASERSIRSKMNQQKELINQKTNRINGMNKPLTISQSSIRRIGCVEGFTRINEKAKKQKTQKKQEDEEEDKQKTNMPLTISQSSIRRIGCVEGKKSNT